MKLIKNKRLTKKEFVDKCNVVHDYKYDYSKTNYINYRTKVEIICPIHGKFIQRAKDHLHSGYGCSECGKENGIKKRRRVKINRARLNTEKYIIKANKIHDNKYNYSKTVYTYGHVKVTITCPIHGDFKQRAVNHLRNHGCSKCGLEKNKRTTLDFINISKKLFPNMLSYKNTIYTSNMNKIKLTCLKHGDFETYAYDHMRGKFGCNLCRESIGESRIHSFLTYENISFIREYKFKNSKSRFEYDFYLPDLNMLIEYDGEQHFKPVKVFGGEKQLIIQKKRDKLKTIMAETNKKHLIRIPYTKLKHVENYLLYRISHIYKYRVNNVFYKNLVDLINHEELDINTKGRDVKQFLTYNKTNCPS